MVKKGKKSQTETFTKSKDIQGFLDELRDESDRAAAIIGAAFLDEQLRQLFANYLVDDGKEVELLLSGESPLGSFAARIRAAYCLGLIASEYFVALKLIKDIRNAFAHQLHGRSFGDSDIVEDCKSLQALMPIKPRVTQTPRQMFESAIMIMLMDICSRVVMVLVERCKTPSAPSITKELSL